MTATMVDLAPPPSVAFGKAMQSRIALYAPLAVLALIVLACFLLPQLAGLPGPSEGSLSEARLPPFSPGHPFGTDALGQDMLSRTLYGGRVSFIVGVASAALGMLIGGTIGIISGFRRGWLDAIVMRCLDILLAFPSLVLALAVAAYLGPSVQNSILAVTVFMVPACARVARARALAVRSEDYIVAARLGGSGETKLIVQHVIPNVISSLVTFTFLQIGAAMIIESSLSFLGLGVRPPTPTWGNMMAAGQEYLSTASWIALVPALFLFVTVCCVNLFGETLRERWDAQ